MAFSWGGAGGGALAGFGAGAMVGGPIGAGVGTIIGAVGGGLMSGKKKSQDQADPLAGIRAQLQSIAAGIPALVEKQKANIRDIYAGYKTEGTQGIGENVYAERGLGNTSIYDRLKAELYDKLAKSQAEAELNAEMSGLSTQANILSGTASMYNTTPPPEEGPSVTSQILGQGANLLTQNWMNTQSDKRQMDWLDKFLKKSPSTVTTA